MTEHSSTTNRIRSTLAVVCCAALASVALVGLDRPTGAAASPVAATSVGAAVSGSSIDTEAVTRRRAHLDLALVSRTWDPVTERWTIVADARLTSNRLCLPVVFNCIVGALGTPSGVQLAALTCESPLWNHLVVFRSHCLKQVLNAGHAQRFRFTWVTDPGIGGSVTLGAEFGRGFLPVTFQQLATATLTVDLDAHLHVAMECPDTVGSGDPVECTIEVDHPDTGGAPADSVVLGDTPDGLLLTGGTLTQTGGATAFTCAGDTCTADAAMAAGDTATFTWAGTAAVTATGGEGTNEAELTWTGGDDAASARMVVVGNGDTEVTIEKSSVSSTATVGGRVDFTVTVTNAGAPGGAPLDATGVVVGDIPDEALVGLTLEFVGGVGEWTCDAGACTAATMPVGVATFTASATVAAGTVPGTQLVNSVAVVWDNDILGPDHPEVAGAAVEATAGAAPTTTTTTTTTTPVPAQPTTPGVAPRPVSFTG